MSSSFPLQNVLTHTKSIYSRFLERDVMLSILLPANIDPAVKLSLLLFNDGQDFGALDIAKAFSDLLSHKAVVPMLIVGIHANHDRIYEYGVGATPDYADRGNKAGLTARFVQEELLPELSQSYPLASAGHTYAGCSLGGLMALDIVWNNPGTFTKAGVFSGALWWRKKALDKGYHDSDRIMHAQIREGGKNPAAKFWFQCGTMDELDDRDGDGVIDSIQDTLECIAELEKKGYCWNREVFYTEVPQGKHNTETWAQLLPQFLKWVSDVDKSN